mgnify:CR=1 FL=1
MAITQAVCNSFKVEILKGLHNFTATTGNTFKLALYDNEATLSKSTTAFTQSDEVANSGTDSEGCGTLTSVTPVLSSDSAVCDFNDISFTSATISAQAAVINNRTTVSGITTNASVCVLDFGDVKTSTASKFTNTFPEDESTATIIRMA